MTCPFLVDSFFPSPYLFLVDCYPVCAHEPLVVLDVVDGVLEVAVPLGQVHLQQVAQQVLQVRAEVGGEADLEREGEERKESAVKKRAVQGEYE